MNNRLNRLVVPIGIVGIVLLLVVPVPARLLDFLIVCNILLALLVLLTSMFVKKPLDFSVFPSLLLVATLFRLGAQRRLDAPHPAARAVRRARSSRRSASSWSAAT